VRRAALAWLAMAAPLAAQGIEAVDYDLVLADAQTIVTFEILPPRAEPGYQLDHGIAFPGGHVGSALAGQRVSSNGPFDRLGGQPTLPLTLVTGPDAMGLSLASHRGFGSMAVYPLGFAGFPAIEARGEGSVAVLFTDDICQVGVLIHSDYPAPLGAGNAPRGAVILTAYGRDAALLGQLETTLSPGLSAHGLRVSHSRAAIVGLTIENTDPGGIALDDLAFGPCAQTLG